jgi:hypothetical protein
MGKSIKAGDSTKVLAWLPSLSDRTAAVVSFKRYATMVASVECGMKVAIDGSVEEEALAWPHMSLC